MSILSVDKGSQHCQVFFFNLEPEPVTAHALVEALRGELEADSVCSKMRVGPRRRCGCPNVEVMAVGLDGHVAAALGGVGSAAAVAKCNAPSQATTSVR